jgi:hypothetical protein
MYYIFILLKPNGNNMYHLLKLSVPNWILPIDGGVYGFRIVMNIGFVVV